MNKMHFRASIFNALLLSSAVGCSVTTSDLGDDGEMNPGVGDGDTSGIGGTGTLGSGGLGSGGLGVIDAGTGGLGTGGGLTENTGGLGAGGTVIHATCPGDAADAYQGIVADIPGTIEAEDFDPAGYADDTTGNEDGEYRTDVAVDIKTLGGGYAISWFTAGEWLEYTVNVPVEGDYAVTSQSGAVDTGRTLLLSSCGDSLGTIAVPQIGDWGVVATSAPITVHLTAGVQVIRVTVGDQDYADFDSLTFELSSETGSGGAGSGGAASGGAASGGSGSGGSGALPKFVGNISTQDKADTDGLTYSNYWDQITPENAGKWGSVQGNIGNQPNWNTLTALYDYAQSKGIIFKQHVFVWGAQQPSGNITETDVKNWMTAFCSRFPNTPVIDVVNEPPPHTEPSYAGAIGGGTNSSWQWIINAFKWADEACPNSVLLLNDFNNIEYGDQNQHFIDIVKIIKAGGAPIDAVGAQSHALHGQYGASTATMKSLLTKLHNDTGLPVHITEYDIGEANDQTQLTKYQEHIGFFLQTEWIEGITLWGWINGKTWIDNSGIMNGQTPRPAMTWLMNTLGRPVP